MTACIIWSGYQSGCFSQPCSDNQPTISFQEVILWSFASAIRLTHAVSSQGSVMSYQIRHTLPGCVLPFFLKGQNIFFCVKFMKLHDVIIWSLNFTKIFLHPLSLTSNPHHNLIITVWSWTPEAILVIASKFRGSNLDRVMLDNTYTHIDELVFVL